jgi:hypothetical protein
MIIVGLVFNRPCGACLLGILQTLGEIASVKYCPDSLGLFVDKPNRSGFGNLLLGLMDQISGPFGKVGIIS